MIEVTVYNCCPVDLVLVSNVVVWLWRMSDCEELVARLE